MKIINKKNLRILLPISLTFVIVMSSMTTVSAGFTDLSDEEIDGILFMREEEKLARDIYLNFAGLYPDFTIFSNIAISEQRHMDSIKKLIDIYGLEDPVGDNSIGIFTDNELQNLYDTLIAQGSQSIVEALNVGAAIEEIDIIDIKDYIVVTNEWIVIRTYNNLLDGSENHLRAFVKELSMEGVSYIPQYLNEEEFIDIMDSDSDSGHNGFPWDEILNKMRELFRWRRR
jgi:hypothetical protein